MAELEHAETGERIEGELQFAAIYKVKGYDEGADEYWEVECICLDRK